MFLLVHGLHEVVEKFINQWVVSCCPISHKVLSHALGPEHICASCGDEVSIHTWLFLHDYCFHIVIVHDQANVHVDMEEAVKTVIRFVIINFELGGS